MLNIYIVAPALPPKLDGIGDNSARLAGALTAAGATITILGPRGFNANPVPGVRIIPAFSPDERRSVWGLTETVAADRPDWVLLQYNPFSYGRWGLNLSLPSALAAMLRRSPGTRLALYAHERFVPADDLKQRIMRLWQQWQFRQLGRMAGVVFESVESVIAQDRRSFPRAQVVHLPVGSNIPRVPIGRDEARARLDITKGESVLGVFGTAHGSRLLRPVRSALDAAVAAGLRPTLLYIGPDVTAVRDVIGSTHRLIADGALQADEVSRRLSAVDVYMGAFSDGVSTRRGSWLAALQHGLACVGTTGKNTDRVFREAADQGAIVLVTPDDPHAFGQSVVDLLSNSHRRRRLADAAESLSMREFAWHKLAENILEKLS